MIRRLFILALLIGTAAGSAWLLKWLSEDPGGTTLVDRHIPDYYMEDFTTVTMKKDGKPKNKLSAVYMAHYPDDDATELLEPRMEIFREDALPLYITAEKGWVDGTGDVIRLHGVVKMWVYDEKGNPTLEVNTTGAKVLLNEEYAETEQYATIATKGSTITGTGIRAYLPERRLEVIKHEKTTINAAADS